MDIKKKTKPVSVDIEYIHSVCYKSEYEIPHFFDEENWVKGKGYRVRVSHVYDPSKFWIVPREKELDVYQKYLHKFYTKNASKYQVPLEKIKTNLYCVVFEDNSFFRGVVVSIPTKISNSVDKVTVFLFDFGCVTTVNSEYVYYLSEKNYKVPQFAIRACLTGVCPRAGVFWNNDVVTKFNDLVKFKVLIAQVNSFDAERRIVYVNLLTRGNQKGVFNISEYLINRKIVEDYSKYQQPKLTENLKYAPKVKDIFLYPLFEAIESGHVPPSVYLSELLLDSVPYDKLHKNYFVYKD